MKPKIYLLRDHITLITDLIRDWVTGPPPDRHRFVPTSHSLNVTLTDYTLHVYLNDHNVVDDPFDADRNGAIRFSSSSRYSDVQCL